jgi:ABC-type multidrug transport system fused ATPase/permease subunit
LILEDGRLVESGSTSELLASGGRLSNLFNDERPEARS